MKTQQRRPPPDKHDANAQDRAIQALKLRKLGFQYEEIAAQCGYNNKGAAWNAVQRLLSKYKTEAVNELRIVETARLDDLLRPFMLRAMKGEKDAAFVVLRIMERRAKLLGLDAEPASAELAQVIIREIPAGLLPLEALNGNHHA